MDQDNDSEWCTVEYKGELYEVRRLTSSEMAALLRGEDAVEGELMRKVDHD